MANPIEYCPIWGGEYPAKGQGGPGEGIIKVTDSARAGGAFAVDYEAKDALGSLSAEQKVLLTTWLVEQRRLGIDSPEVTSRVLEYIKTKRPLSVQDRAMGLLRFLAKEAKLVSDFTKIIDLDQSNGRTVDDPASLLTYRAMAWSESSTPRDVFYLRDYLETKGLVSTERPAIWVTVDGYSQIAELEVNVDSSQAFVAMWFNEEMKEAYDKGIEPAIKEAGYSSLRIDRKDYLGKVEDEIIAEIRRSRFLVADFTQGDDGARGGVYYEAGFAQGLDLPVIFTCREDSFDKVHFDTNHFNHIVWSGVPDLKEKLRVRILAVIGQGPKPD